MIKSCSNGGLVSLLSWEDIKDGVRVNMALMICCEEDWLIELLYRF
jgi:hypothetical protein